jgi:hypothetical protein
LSAQPPKPVIPLALSEVEGNPRASCGVRDLLSGFRGGLIVDDNKVQDDFEPAA